MGYITKQKFKLYSKFITLKLKGVKGSFKSLNKKQKELHV